MEQERNCWVEAARERKEFSAEEKQGKDKTLSILPSPCISLGGRWGKQEKKSQLEITSDTERKSQYNGRKRQTVRRLTRVHE